MEYIIMQKIFPNKVRKKWSAEVVHLYTKIHSQKLIDYRHIHAGKK